MVGVPLPSAARVVEHTRDPSEQIPAAARDRVGASPSAEHRGAHLRGSSIGSTSPSLSASASVRSGASGRTRP